MNNYSLGSATSIILLLLGGFLGYLVGEYRASHINYLGETASLISCQSYSDEFLEYFGATSRGECESLNWELYNQATDKCEEVLSNGLKMSNSHYEDLFQKCVYYSLKVDIGIIEAAAFTEFQERAIK